jgi:hypothetical protein
MMSEMEIFKTIDGCHYSVSNFGNVRNDKTNRILKGRKCRGGYLRVSLCKNGQTYDKQVHQLVAIAFIENPENKPWVDHINGDKVDNHVKNLRWATASENHMNSEKRKDNTSGIKGVSLDKRRNQWCAHIQFEGKVLHLGLFDDIEKAKEARLNAVQKIFKEFAHASEKMEQDNSL